MAAHQITLFVTSLMNRNNVLLLGDELGNTDMADGVQNAGTVLKIGFLFGQVRKAQKYLWIKIAWLHDIMLLES
jgi:hypothetical protein